MYSRRDIGRLALASWPLARAFAVQDSNLNAAVVPVGPARPLTVSEFIPAQKPGNVAVCLSGGGSRALSAGMGQLNSLRSIPYASNLSLLSQTKALSTVSGGSWLGVPFTYLPSAASDANYLGGPYVQPTNLTVPGLGALPAGCIAANVTSNFAVTDMLSQAILLYLDGVPSNMLWQTLIGLHLLTPYGLFTYTSNAYAPNSFFTYQQAQLNAIVAANPPLQPETASLVSTRPRPYMVCNTAVFVTSNGQSLLAPVQATSFMTGVISTPNATDANGFPVGGGGVTSLAFNSAPVAFNPSRSLVTVSQQRQWALLDIVGSSSAAFAATLQQLAAAFAVQPTQFAQLLRDRGPAAADFLMRRGVPLSAGSPALASALAAQAVGDQHSLDALIAGFSNLVPAYQYWGVASPPVGSNIQTSQFADGGSLENLGVADALAYGDIDNVISFINSETAITKDAAGIIVVDSSIPPLFGYQPYVAGVGYVPYSGASKPNSPLTRKNQIFPSSAFQSLLNNLWSASGSGSYQNAPIYAQPLTTVANPWFGVAGSRQVTVLWVYLERVKAWYDQLPAAVQSILGPFDSMANNFPHYGTFSTQLSATQINLLANLTSWTVMNAQSQFQARFH